MKIIDGKMIANEIKQSVKQEVETEFISKGKKVPCLACIIVEGNKASEVYVASKQKACAFCNMDSTVIRLSENCTEEELFSVIDELNADENVSGILLQLPLPNGLDSVRATNRILPQKDVDCLTYENLGALFSAKKRIAPCTATGIIKMLKHENIEISGKRAVVIGRSLLVGKSVANLLEQENATVTICHSRTQNIKEITSEADILVVAIGKPKYVTDDFVKDNAVVIDVGINRTDEGLVGDVDFENVKDKCSYISPVPGGVGPLTVACLMENTLLLHKEALKGE